MKGTDLAPAGQIFICGACGARARSRYGFDVAGAPTTIDKRWDESCSLNAVLCYENKLDGMYHPVEPQPEKEPGE